MGISIVCETIPVTTVCIQNIYGDKIHAWILYLLVICPLHFIGTISFSSESSFILELTFPSHPYPPVTFIFLTYFFHVSFKNSFTVP